MTRKIEQIVMAVGMTLVLGSWAYSHGAHEEKKAEAPTTTDSAQPKQEISHEEHSEQKEHKEHAEEKHHKKEHAEHKEHPHSKKMEKLDKEIQMLETKLKASNLSEKKRAKLEKKIKHLTEKKNKHAD